MFRVAFTGIHEVHALLSIEKLPVESPSKAVLRRNMIGAFLTADHLVHRGDAESGLCKLCGQADSIERRLWECE